jgi:hypothetical protein
MKSRPLSILSIGSYLLAVAGGICGMVTEINEEQVSQQYRTGGYRSRKSHAGGTRSRGSLYLFRWEIPESAVHGIFEASSPLAKDKTLDALAGKQIGISGKITEYNGKPEIVISSLAQILRE